MGAYAVRFPGGMGGCCLSLRMEQKMNESFNDLAVFTHDEHEHWFYFQGRAQ